MLVSGEKLLKIKFVALASIFAATAVCASTTESMTEAQAASDKIALSSLNGFESLPPGSACEDPARGVKAYRFTLEDGTKVALLRVETGARQLLPGFGPRTAPTSVTLAQKVGIAGVNGGYFNLSDGESASYLVSGGKVEMDPTKNKALTGNKRLQPFLPQIFDRSELRFYKGARGAARYAIAKHSQPVPAGEKLVWSLQGGPRLLPELTAEAEAFLRKEADGKMVDSIGVNRTAARTAVGIGSLGELLVVSVCGKGQDEFSSGLTLADLAQLLTRLGASEALNFDGGTSTTMVVKKGAGQEMLIGRSPETLVRSILYLK